MERADDPFNKTWPVALYKDIEHGWIRVATFYGADDTVVHRGSVRISEVFEVPFTKLASDTVIQGAIASLNETEKQVRAEFNDRLAAIKEQRSQLLALTYQPEVSA